MSEQSPYDHAPYEQTPYGQGPAAPAPVAYRRPALTPAQKRGAMIAGGVGFTLMTLGFSLLGVALAVLFIALIIGGIAGLVERSGESTGGFMEWFTTVASDFGWIVAVVAVVGVLIWLAGYFASVRILRSNGNPRATAITWSALGLAIVASWIVGTVISIPAQVTGAFEDFDRGLGQASIAVGLVSGAVSIAATVAIGVFAWWWMAHAFRQPTVGESTTPTRSTGGPAVP